MKKPIITIERQYGSGGSVIGNLVAEKLGINCYNRQILKMTAERCGIAVKNLENAEENVPTSFLYSLLLSANPARTPFWGSFLPSNATSKLSVSAYTTMYLRPLESLTA